MARMRFGKRALVQGSIAAAAIAAIVAAFAVKQAQAHKAVTSPYDFKADIFPILRDGCGRCHVEGGPAMTLMSYKADNGGASAWAEQIREMLVTEQMPPWFVDRTSPAIKGMHNLSNRDLDKLITWAAGGTPEGDLDKKAPVAAPYQPQWRGGQPDLKLEMPQPFTLAAGSDAPPETKEFVIPTNLAETKWVRMADLLPGSPIVRNATISVENGPVLAVWVPGSDAVPAPSGAAFKVPAGAKLLLHIRYQKQWWNMNAVTDKSTVGLYFTDEPASGRELQAFPVEGPSAEAAEPEKPHSVSKKLTGAARVVALRPRLDQAYAALAVHAVTPSGRRVTLLSLRSPRPEWNRRYWLAEPTELPAGSTIEVTITPLPADFELPFKPVLAAEPLQVSLDYVPQ